VLPSLHINEIGASKRRFAAQYPAYGLLCERFALALAGHHASLEAGANG
jgi:hypothetical protein